MFGFSIEHLFVLLVILLIFGPKRLPDLGHSLGRGLKNFKDAMGGEGFNSSSQTTQIEKKKESAETLQKQSEQPLAKEEAKTEEHKTTV